MKLLIFRDFRLNRDRRHPRRDSQSAISLMAFGLSVFVGCVFGQTQGPIESPSVMKTLSVEELMDIDVTSVSRRPEKLSEAASAIQVITAEDILRSGATSIPEALRLATNLQVAEVSSTQWAISARGFNSTAADKLLVMIDGRTVYTPLYSGVFWDVQDTLLDDIDRIEVISGPGATLWGANAVNGVINITTKLAKDTQGLLLEGGGGTEYRDFGAFRYGAKLADNVYFRIYGKYFDRDSTVFSNGSDADNDWYMGQGGFRLDWQPSSDDLFTLQGDGYGGRESQLNQPDVTVDGNNVIGRWSHTISADSNFTLQLYWDRTHRNFPGVFSEDLDTYDIDFQHRFALGDRNNVIWGLGYRLIEDDVGNSAVLAFLPAHVARQWFSGFVQDEIALVKNRLHLTIGLKIEHNDYTGWEFQPSGRIAWKVTNEQTIWGAISRAVRTPSRIDTDLFAPGHPPFTILQGGPDFVSEKVIAYELGYRVQPDPRLSLSLAAFYNDYNDLRSVEQVNPPNPVPVVLANGQEGESYGAELTATYQVTDWWRLHAGYTELRVHIRPKSGSTDTTHGSGESHDPEHQFSLRSSLDLPGHVEFDAMLRYVSEISNQSVPAYTELDVRLAWKPTPHWELSIVGQNLLHDRHAEFGAAATRQEVERGVYGKVTWHF